MPSLRTRANPDDLQHLSGWARSSRVLSQVRSVESRGDVAEALDRASPRGLIPRGAGHSYGDAAHRAGGDVLLMRGLNRMLSFDGERGEATVEAGIELRELMREIVPLGWLPPVLPSTSRITVGGAIAADIHARNQQRDGNFGHHVRELLLCTPNGPLVVGPHLRPDLFWATAGGMGLTGVILEATLRLTRIETGHVLVSEVKARDLDEVMALLEDVSRAHHYAAAWVDCLRKPRGVVVHGDHATGDEVRERGVAPAPEYSPARGMRLPGRMPRLLGASSIRALNELVFKRAPATAQPRLQSIRRFFFMHDWLENWLQLCGAGFVEYQFVVPPERADVIREVIERVGRARAQPLFAVLKRMGKESPGGLSFPMPGWEFAMDMPFDPSLDTLIHELDGLVAAAGGRVYLAKDARLRADTLAEMYPRLPQWLQVRERHDPERVMCSDLAERLDLA